MKTTAIANANIALAKYWGKRSKDLILPHNGSISVTLDGTPTRTTVVFSDKFKENLILINGEKYSKDEKDLEAHIERIFKMYDKKPMKYRVESISTVPVAAGLASSAAGIAALTLAVTKALEIKLSERELTILTRIGSGSACRSIQAGFVEWLRGEKEDGSDSYAEMIADEDHWKEFRIIATIISEVKKPVSSRAGMEQTVNNCPFYNAWVESVPTDLKKIKEAILNKDIVLLGETAEMNSLKMHSTMMTTTPSIIYWLPGTLDIMHTILKLREEGIKAYFTMDAGPNVKIICLDKDVKKIEKELLKLPDVIKTITCKPGKAAYISTDHLF